MLLTEELKKLGLDITKPFTKEILDIFGGRMRVIISGGAAINPEILQFFNDIGIIAVQGYGLTECSPMTALNPDVEKYMKNTSAGHLLPGMEVKIADADEDGIGEICFKGANVMLGYYNNPEATADVIRDGWFHTGDLGYVDEDNFIFITGRKKNVIITKNGKNVYPEEIEYYIDMNEFVEESMVYEDSNTAGDDTIIVAAIKCNDEEVAAILGENYTDEDVKKLVWDAVDKINDEAPAYRKIKRVIVRKTNFVRNSTAKIIRSHADNKTE